MSAKTFTKLIFALDEFVNCADDLRTEIAEVPDLDPRLADAFREFANRTELEARTNEQILTTVVNVEEEEE